MPVVQGARRLNNPDVTMDGTMITYQAEGAQQDIFVAGTDGANEQQVTDDLSKDWAPRWSPDGQKIAFYTNFGGDYEIWVMNRDGSARTRLTDTTGRRSSGQHLVSRRTRCAAAARMQLKLPKASYRLRAVPETGAQPPGPCA